MFFFIIRLLLSLVLFISNISNVTGQKDDWKLKIITDISADLKRKYISSKLAIDMSDYILKQYKNGNYEADLNLDEFLYELTMDLRTISRDMHITVYSLGQKCLDDLGESQSTKKSPSQRLKKSKVDDLISYGDMRFLGKDVGYIEIRNFESNSISSKLISTKTVFKKFRSANAIIIDLRENNGGVISSVANFSSYFSSEPNKYFYSQEIYLRYVLAGVENEVSARKHLFTSKSISNKYVAGKKIFVLISKRTFSAAEILVYKIRQYMPSIIVVGEKTLGGGNGYEAAQVGQNYYAIIPTSRSFDSLKNGYTIEGQGIVPDILVDSKDALEVAYRLANNEKSEDVKPDLLVSQPIDKGLGGEKDTLSQYIGEFRKAIFVKEGGELYIYYDFFLKERLIPLPNFSDAFYSNSFDLILFKKNTYGVIGEVQVKMRKQCPEIYRKKV